jgi:TonB-dependent SusC/RagA subfamily outer membrane receptor
MNVLKDAATTAIYGVKGGNGVIVVTTKQVKKTENRVNGKQQLWRRRRLPTMGVLNATEYGAMINEGSVAAAVT